MAAQLASEAEDTERRRQVIEQERRDRELALRLAQEDQDQVEDVSLPAPSASSQYVIVHHPCYMYLFIYREGSPELN